MTIPNTQAPAQQVGELTDEQCEAISSSWRGHALDGPFSHFCIRAALSQQAQAKGEAPADKPDLRVAMIQNTDGSFTPCFPKSSPEFAAQPATAPSVAPIGYMSPQQVSRIVDPDGTSGTYIPMRATPAGNFTLALHPAPQATPQAAPAAVERKPLTDEQIEQAFCAAFGHRPPVISAARQFARAILAAGRADAQPAEPDHVELALKETHAAEAMQWPTSRDVARLEDMSPRGHLRITFDNDNDVCVEVFNGEEFAAVEFCNGGGGGGKSRHTRLALIEVMCAMERDNAERPDRAHPRFGASRAEKGGAL